MNDRTQPTDETDRDEQTMARLLRLSGSRASVSKDAESRVYARVLREWQAATRAPESERVYRRVHREWSRSSRRPGRFRRFAVPMAAAAATLIVAVIVMQQPPVDSLPAPIGSIARVSGGATAGGPAAGDPVRAGDRLATAKGEGIGIALRDGESVRLDENTTLVAVDRDHFRLLRGRIYADTGDFLYRQRALVVDTAFGAVTDVGTQFVVALDDERLDVAVREGRVDVVRDDEKYVAVAGERLGVSRDDGATVAPVALRGAFWDWATVLAPPFELENKSLLDFLRWAARETGRELVFANDDLRMAAMRIDLHGSVADFTPLEALESVMSGTRLHYRVEADRIVIED